MSDALEQASLIMVPSGYENGTLGSLKPLDGTGDFTFSRGSNLAATRVNKQGYIEKGYENLLYGSNTLNDLSYWSQDAIDVPTGGQLGYDGSNNAWLVNKTSTANASIINSAPLPIGNVSTLSFYAKAETANCIDVYLGGATRIAVNLNTGDTYLLSGNIDFSITDAGNGYKKIVFTYVSQLSTFRFQINNNNAGGATGSIYLQNFQINQGLVAYPYVETTTAPVAGGILEDMPRLDYTDSSCPALLLEPQRTNLTTNSEYAIVTNGGITYNDAISPEGVQNALKITATSAAFPRFFGTTTLGGGNTYIVSFYAKKGVGDGVGLYGYSSVNYNNVVRFNLDTNEVTYLQTAFSNGYIEDAGNGWKRCVAKLTTPATGNWSGINAVINKSNFLQAEVGDEHYFYGMQVEQDATYATSYIPTYGTSQTRLAEDVNLNLSTAWDSTGNWTLVWDVTRINDNSTNEFQVISLGGPNGSVRLDLTSPNKTGVLIREVGGQYNVVNINNLTAQGEQVKAAVKNNGTTMQVFINGTQYTPSNPTYLAGSFTNYIVNRNHTTHKEVYFPTALSDDECIALTTIS